MLECSPEQLWVRTTSVFPSRVWERGTGQVSFHTNSFHVDTVMGAKTL